MKLTIEPATEKPIEKWNSKDILLYFASKWKTRTGQEFRIPPAGWPGFMSHIKQFQIKNKLSNGEYKDFIDQVVDVLFTSPDFVPNFGCIVSEKVLWVVRNKLSETVGSDFEKLRDEFYKDSILFSQI